MQVCGERDMREKNSTERISLPSGKTSLERRERERVRVGERGREKERKREKLDRANLPVVGENDTLEKRERGLQ